MRALLLAVILVGPFGQFAVAQDLEAIERHLGAAVYEGMLTLRQANIMFEALKASQGKEPATAMESNFQKRIGMAEQKLRAAVETGKLDPMDARKKMEALKKRAMMTRQRMEIRDAIESGDLTPEQAREKLEWLRDRVRELRKSDAQARDGREDRRERAKRDDDDGARKRRADSDRRPRPDNRERRRPRPTPTDDRGDAGARSHLRRLGVAREAIEGVRQALSNAGIDEEQMRPAMGGILRVVWQMKTGDDGPRMDRLEEFLAEDVGLDREQITLVQRLAKRLANASKKQAGQQNDQSKKKEKQKKPQRDKNGDQSSDQSSDKRPSISDVIFVYQYEPFHDND